MTKYQKYAEYKDSGLEWLGSIPSHWEVKKLKYLGEAIIGLTYSPDDVVDEGEGTLVLRSSNIQNKKLAFDDNVYVNKEIPEKLRTKKNDILICARNGSRALIGKNALIDESAEGVSFGAFMSIFRSKYNNYLSKVFNSALFEYQSGTFLTATINQLTTGNLNSFEVPLPPLEERELIANFLDHETAKIDTLIAKQEKLIELLKEKRQAVISHAVTKGSNPDVTMKDSGVEWLGRVPEHWGIWKFSHIAPIITCGVASTPTYVDESEGMPFLSAQNIKNNKLSLHKFNHIPYELHEQLTRYRRPERGDILVTRVGAGIGEACIVDIDLEFSIYVSLTHIRVRPEIAHNKFIMYFFGTDYCKFLNFDGTVTGGGVGNLNVNNVVKYRIALPTIEEQKQITDYLDNYIEKQDQLIAKAQSAIQLMQERRTALISSAVTGKIDVRNWQYPNEATTELSQ